MRVDTFGVVVGRCVVVVDAVAFFGMIGDVIVVVFYVTWFAIDVAPVAGVVVVPVLLLFSLVLLCCLLLLVVNVCRFVLLLSFVVFPAMLLLFLCVLLLSLAFVVIALLLSLL